MQGRFSTHGEAWHGRAGVHPEHPREAADAHGEVGHDAGLRGMQVCTERRAAVEACTGLEVRVRVRVRQGAGGGRGKGVTYQRKTSMHTHAKKPTECAHLQPIYLHMPAPVWEDTHAPLIISVLFLSVHSRSSSLSAVPSFLAFFLRGLPVHGAFKLSTMSFPPPHPQSHARTPPGDQVCHPIHLHRRRPRIDRLAEVEVRHDVIELVQDHVGDVVLRIGAVVCSIMALMLRIVSRVRYPGEAAALGSASFFVGSTMMVRMKPTGSWNGSFGEADGRQLVAHGDEEAQKRGDIAGVTCAFHGLWVCGQ